MKPVIYLLEDNKSISELIQIMLTDFGFDVIGCKTIASLSDLLVLGLPDLLIMDVHLPDGNGKHKCIEIRKNTLYDAVPILMISAADNAKHLEWEFQRVKFLQKPFSVADFESIVKSLINDNLSYKKQNLYQ